MPVGGVEDDEWPDDPAQEGLPPSSTNVGPISTAPPLSSTAPGDSTDAHRVTAAEMSGDEAKPSAFPEEYRQDFEGLLYIGRLTDTFTWLGHTFVIRTLSDDDLLEMAILHKPYVGTVGEAKAYQTLMVAACVESVDGRPLPSALGPEENDLVHRFNYVRKWYSVTQDAIYERFLLLEQRVIEVVKAMGEAVG